jgi:uncharacterized membrane protein
MESNLAIFVGRFHPLVVHLPIALVMVLALVEGVSLVFRRQLPDFWLRLLLVLTAAGAMTAVGCGWLLASGGGYDPGLLNLHRWLGTAVGGLAVVALVVQLTGSTIGYRIVLGAMLATLGAASHLGGSITHGETYLTDAAPEPIRRLLGSPRAVAVAKPALTDSGQAEIHDDVIHPILKKYCSDCHGPGKQQGSLRLDLASGINKGGASGPLVIAGKPELSLLLQRLDLPESDSKRMPPAGRPRPEFNDLELLRWWVASGAPTTGLVSSVQVPGPVAVILDDRLLPAVTGDAPKLADLRTTTGTLARDLGIDISVTPRAESGELAVNASVADHFTDAELKRLLPFAPQIRSLSLAGTAITPAAATSLAAMTGLTALDLSRTAIDDPTVAALAPLRRLESLNLYGTAVSDAALAKLTALPRLHRVYAWQTKVTSAAALAFAKQQTDERRISDLHRRVAELERELQRTKAAVDLGMTAESSTAAKAAAPAATEAAPALAALNSTCPVSGKPVDPAITRTINGRVIAFCCPKCPTSYVPPKAAK